MPEGKIPWYKRKTNRTIMVGMFAAVFAFIAQEITLVHLIEAIVLGLVGIFARQGMAKAPGE